MRSISYRFAIVASIAALLAFPTRGAAGFLLPDDMSTDQTWTFNTPQPNLSNILPDRGSVTAPGPLIQTHLDATGATLDPLAGILEIGSGKHVDFVVADFARTDLGKMVTVDVTYRLGLDSLTIAPPSNVNINDFNLIPSSVSNSRAPGGFILLHAQWMSGTCPQNETITITNTSITRPQLALAKVRIQTQCVPEPSALTLFGLGTLGLLGFARLRRKPTAA